MQKKETLVDKVLKTIKMHKLIKEGEGVVAGVSGGPDSVCLLHVLREIADLLKFNLYAVHVNHMLRGGEADDDQKYVTDLCKGLNVPLYVFRCNVGEIADQKGLSIEEAGRDARYAKFRLVAEQTGSGRIAVAHNKNDQAETIILHILRGSGTDGLKGMEYIRGNVIRPLLGISRQEIEEYCGANNLAARTDRSNLETIYTRNRVRIELLPLMSEIMGTDSIDMLWRLSEKVADDAAFLDGFTSAAFLNCTRENDSNGINLDINALTALHPAIKKRVLRMALSHLKEGLTGIEGIHVEQISELADKGRSGSELHLPGGLRAVKNYGLLYLGCEKEHCSGNFGETLKLPGRTGIRNKRFAINASIEKNTLSIEQYFSMGYNSLVQFFDYDKTGMVIYLRNRRDGDRFKPLGSNGTKKLKEYFIDAKIPRRLREEIPLITRENEVVWIIGYKISDKFKVTENTKNVLRLEFVTSDAAEGEV